MRRLIVPLLWVVVAQNARAAPITFEFTGIVAGYVEDNGDYLDGSIVPGGTFSGTYTFESSTPDDYPDDPARGTYTFATSSDFVMTLHIGDYDLVAPLEYIRVAHSSTDDYGVATRAFTFDNVQARVGLGIVSPTGGLFSTDALPLFPPDVQLPPPAKASILFSGAAGPGPALFYVTGQVTSLVPEPHSIAFLLVSLLGMGCVGKTNKKS